MASATLKGLAIINAIVGGVPTNVAALAAVLPQSHDVTLNFDEEVIKDSTGFDGVWIARNSHLVRQFEFKPTAATLTAAKSATAFYAAYAKFTFSGSDASDLDGDWQIMSGQNIAIKNDASATVRVTCRKYQDSTQNTAANTAVTNP